MFGKIARLMSLFKGYGWHAFHLLLYPKLGRNIWINVRGRKVWLNYDPATYYHLINSIDKVTHLVDAIPGGLEGDIIDGGANHGIFSILAAQKFRHAHVLAMEPYDVVLPILKKNVAGLQVTVIEKALSDKDGEAVLYTTPDSDQIGSLLKENVSGFMPKNSIITEKRIAAVSLESLVKERGIKQVAVLKLDVQGAEFSILQNADYVLDMTACLVLEVMLVEPSSLDLLNKVRQFFPYHKVLNPLPYGADIIFAKQPFDNA